MKSATNISLHLTAVVAALLFFCVSFVNAQTVQTGIVTGTVVDSDGEPLTGVRVLLVLDAITVQRVSTVTDFDGNFRIPGLPPGIYRLEAFIDDYHQEKQLYVNLRVGAVERLEIVMLSGPSSSSEPVLGGPMVFLENDGIALTLERGLLERAPLGRNIFAAAGLAPGFVQTPEGLSVHGADVRANSFLYDGIDVTDPFTGLGILEVEPERAKSVDLATANRDVRLGRSSGGTINIFTQAGQSGWSTVAGFSTDQGEGSPAADSPDGAIVKNYRGFGAVGSSFFNDKVWAFGQFNRYTNEESDQVDPFRTRDQTGFSVNARGRIRTSPNNVVSFGYIGQGLSSIGHYAPSNVNWDIRELDPDQVTSDYESNIDFIHISDDFRVSDIMQLRVSASWMSHREDVLPTSDNRFVPGLLDPQQNILYQGSYLGTWSKRTNNRLRFDGGIDFYLDEIAGTHSIQLGMEVESINATENWGVQGFYREYVLLEQSIARDYAAGTDGIPADISSEISILRFSLSGQDTWFPTSRLGVTFGVRYNGPQAENRTVRTLDWDDISPRISASYDLFGDSSLILRGGYARYHQAALGVRTLTDPYADVREFWDRNLEEIGYPIYGERNPRWRSNYNASVHRGYDGSDWMQANSDTNAPYTDEFFLMAENEPFDNVMLGMQFVYRRTEELLEDVDIGFNDLGEIVIEPGSNYTSQSAVDYFGNNYIWWQRNPDANGSFSQQLLWDNVSDHFREFTALELWWRTRSLAGLRLTGSYAYSVSKGNIDVNLEESSGFSKSNNNPSAFTNSDGYLSSDIRHRLKLAAVYALPFDVYLGSVITYRSGAPYDRLLWNPDLYSLKYEIRADPRGEGYRYEDQLVVDIRLEKEFPILEGNISAALDVFNLFDERAVTLVDTRDGPTFGEPLARLTPRTIRIALRYTF